MESRLAELLHRFARPGRVAWIGLRPERRAPMAIVEQARLTEVGLKGDHSNAGKRAVTLIQAEHLSVIGAFLGAPPIAPERLRRNLVIEGINLLALRGEVISVGPVSLEITGPCAPCSRMEQELGHGGYAAMRGHGGMTARVIEGGTVQLGDELVHRSRPPNHHPTV
ncbi:MAG: MOSC domain-containing protein [Pseudomonadota bacterium]